MATNRCQQILMAADNDITVAAYNIFCECQSNENIKAQNWEELIASLGEEDKKKLDDIVRNLTPAWMDSAPCANLVALVRWRKDARGLLGMF
ncbi:hypothetical protein CUC08_Gglean013081 [Alternaria sp. MG1]|jgi:hypothetical protein|uniref:Uncharacterized protein n=2 Tax=Alternaria alternata complex TaxID=187734 RepID=A0A4Q4N9P9_ALTAL|nr:hypothetical protein AALT_g10027 [Alternaria alternata]RII23002.1 hypothetical protein CUC08_Gglean013081 [Alternaria sp. MG1]RYN31710.1 hypothetical protein AA0115_g3907 [Alternaria tenuissima]RYN51984.1 hypothetical protein AA0118_g10331 [Alternaria tenuissima]RYN54942.1 hypothetical protein AA0114_g3699 [Alternaria tenuissima]